MLKLGLTIGKINYIMGLLHEDGPNETSVVFIYVYWGYNKLRGSSSHQIITSILKLKHDPSDPKWKWSQVVSPWFAYGKPQNLQNVSNLSMWVFAHFMQTDQRWLTSLHLFSHDLILDLKWGSNEGSMQCRELSTWVQCRSSPFPDWYAMINTEMQPYWHMIELISILQTHSISYNTPTYRCVKNKPTSSRWF